MPIKDDVDDLEEIWYSWDTKEIGQTGQWINTNFTYSNQALFVRGGSILTILSQIDCTAILNCVTNMTELQVYVNANQEATGNLYIDDGDRKSVV